MTDKGEDMIQLEKCGKNKLKRFFDRQLEQWPDVKTRFQKLAVVQVRDINCGTNTVKVQFNSARMVSTGARIDKQSLGKRPCFLCEKNRPEAQISKFIDGQFELLINPFPILPMHFTIPAHRHQPQHIYENYGEIHRILTEFDNIIVFYNGPKCGASAPDHLHFQGGTSGILPLQTSWQRLSANAETVVAINDEEYITAIRDFICPAFCIHSRTEKSDITLFRMLYAVLPKLENDTEPMMNIVSWRTGGDFISVVFPRRKHRPACYDAVSSAQLLVSPGAIDMGGLLILPREEDYFRITPETIQQIYDEVSITFEDQEIIGQRLKDSFSLSGLRQMEKPFSCQPLVTVGIVSGNELHLVLNKPYMAKGKTVSGAQTVSYSEGGILWNGNHYRELTFQPQATDASFTLDDVTIGIDFHWERKETQTFPGTLRLVVDGERILAINELPVEKYLESVISSEMRATSSLELLKAHAIISRSWLLAQMLKRRSEDDETRDHFSFVKRDDELIRWYDHEDHTLFDVCADDHCQRYQGITKAASSHVAEAVRTTRGQVLMSEGEICDARFSKCCGGVSEEYQFCWEDTPKPYLIAVRDADERAVPNLQNEENALRWIHSESTAFCNTQDKEVLLQVLNDYDQETADFYRWHVHYTQEELSTLIQQKTKMDFGCIVDLIPLERGKSGRISRLKIVGTKRSFIIGKELEIRRTLSETHLYSSAFVVEKSHFETGIPQQFDIHGAGWGHGVGLCQIGAAVMGADGYRYDEILLHYYRGATINKLYK